MDDLNDCVTEYIKFCESNCSVEKNIKVYNNSKPWINKDLKSLIIEKQKAHKNKEYERIKSIKKELKSKIQSSKKSYKDKVESSFESMDSKGMWNGLKTMSGMKKTSKEIPIKKGTEKDYAEDLNKFYARFDTYDFSKNIQTVKEDLSLTTENDFLFEIKPYEVLSNFRKLKQCKASGPDNISCKVLKLCSRELSHIFCTIFNMSITSCKIPSLWKTSKIIPVPKTNSISQMNDLRPVALTSVAMKCLEKIVLKNFLPFCQPHLDNFQFAYKARRGVEDAILFFSNNVYSHLDRPKGYVRTLFIDFSSAFNTIQPHILIPKLQAMNIPNSISLWLLDFLVERPQFVFLQLKNTCVSSDMLITNTGAPQGTVLAPILFSIYTNDCTTIFENIPILKYADDTSIQALVSNDVDLVNYYSEVERFVQWCDSNYLLLNVKKTKELVIDFRKAGKEHDPIIIKGEEVERVTTYKYLGVVFDENLDWVENSNKVQKKVNQRVHFMNKVSKFHIDNKILSLFFESCIISVMTFCIKPWGGNIKAKRKQSIGRAIKYGYKLVNTTFFMTLVIHYLLLLKENSIL